MSGPDPLAALDRVEAALERVRSILDAIDRIPVADTQQARRVLLEQRAELLTGFYRDVQRALDGNSRPPEATP